MANKKIEKKVDKKKPVKKVMTKQIKKVDKKKIVKKTVKPVKKSSVEDKLKEKLKQHKKVAAASVSALLEEIKLKNKKIIELEKKLKEKIEEIEARLINLEEENKYPEVLTESSDEKSSEVAFVAISEGDSTTDFMSRDTILNDDITKINYENEENKDE